MPLDSLTLTADLKLLQTSFPSTIADAANAWASAYAKYAKTATAAGSIPASISSDPLSKIFLASMNAQTFLEDMDVNLTAFWLTLPAPITFTGASNGAVTVIAGGSALKLQMKAISEGSLAGKIKDPIPGIALAMDVFTKTVTAALLPPSGPPPIPTLLI